MRLTDRYNDALCLLNPSTECNTERTSILYFTSHDGIALTLENGGDEDQAIAALLHDAVEDQGGEARLIEIESRFGKKVAQIVADCTDAWVEPKPPWKERKVAYIRGLSKKSKTSLLVSLADKTHNAEAICQ